MMPAKRFRLLLTQHQMWGANGGTRGAPIPLLYYKRGLTPLTPRSGASSICPPARAIHVPAAGAVLPVRRVTVMRKCARLRNDPQFGVARRIDLVPLLAEFRA